MHSLNVFLLLSVSDTLFLCSVVKCIRLRANLHSTHSTTAANWFIVLQALYWVIKLLVGDYLLLFHHDKCAASPGHYRMATWVDWLLLVTRLRKQLLYVVVSSNSIISILCSICGSSLLPLSAYSWLIMPGHINLNLHVSSSFKFLDWLLEWPA